MNKAENLALSKSHVEGVEQSTAYLKVLLSSKTAFVEKDAQWHIKRARLCLDKVERILFPAAQSLSPSSQPEGGVWVKAKVRVPEDLDSTYYGRFIWDESKVILQFYQPYASLENLIKCKYYSGAGIAEECDLDKIEWLDQSAPTPQREEGEAVEAVKYELDWRGRLHNYLAAYNLKFSQRYEVVKWVEENLLNP